MAKNLRRKLIMEEKRNIVVKFKNGQINHYVFPSEYTILDVLESLKDQHNQDFTNSEISYDVVLIEQK